MALPFSQALHEHECCTAAAVWCLLQDNTADWLKAGRSQRWVRSIAAGTAVMLTSVPQTQLLASVNGVAGSSMLTVLSCSAGQCCEVRCLMPPGKVMSNQEVGGQPYLDHPVLDHARVVLCWQVVHIDQRPQPLRHSMLH